MKKNELRAFLHLPTEDENGSGNILVFPKSGTTR
jgi:hypothetical protein